ncbi:MULTISPECIES: hypothetical protein [Rhodobacterales]|uniref:hypothetical protein n=1 Tax=Rhodobacterales TaxID=204455 RepID=UPI0015F0A861|nr:MULTISPECIES: hypothetical protein [Rhodobacterales]MDO6591284.1 hypothetical protein [Yoonia sp. 1_MG-2023]
MAGDRKMDVDFLGEDATDFQVPTVHFPAEDDAREDRFPDVDDILDRLTTNTEAVEKK